jgi:hypothetical protein
MKRLMPHHGWLLLTAALAGAPVALAAQSPREGEADRAEWTVAPYLLIPTMSGDLTVGNQSIGVDAGPGDIFDKLQFGAMLYVQVRKGGWGGAVDGLYMNLEQDAKQAGVTAGAKQGMVDMSAFRRLTPAIDVLLGARVNILESSLDLPTPGVSVSASKTWVDPVVGVQLHQQLGTSRWTVGMRADIGGFGIGSSFAYQLYPQLGFRASHLISIHAAYRLLNMDYDTGSGNDYFRYDMSIFGPEFGLAFHF